MGLLFTEFPKACLIMTRIRKFVLDMLSLRRPLDTHFERPEVIWTYECVVQEGNPSQRCGFVLGSI